MSEYKVIKTPPEYETALVRLSELMEAAPGSPEEAELELLSLLLNQYEQEHFPIDLPDPVEAIRFRMEQQGLQPRDLVPYLGSQSRVSEVLNRKRPLSLAMIRSLHRGLDIPLEVLVQEPAHAETAAPTSQESDHRFYANLPVLEIDSQAGDLQNWVRRALEKASTQKLPPFDWQQLDEDTITGLMRLSAYTLGPQMACEHLNQKGIHLVVQVSPSIRDLDGVWLVTREGHPLIGLTLRDDRLDSFWYTLLQLFTHILLQKGQQPQPLGFGTLVCVFDHRLFGAEEQVEKALKDHLQKAAMGNRPLTVYLAGGDRSSLDLAYSPKKINEKLEVYG